MKSSLRKLRGFALHHKNDNKDRRELHHPPAKEDELVHAAQDMLDMRNCYDSLLSAAAATANSAYEFSEALREMGSCLLEKTALNDDEDSGRILLMLGKAQFELQKLVDNYRAHIIQTITTPSESLLKELQTVEEMKRQCDDKRDLYKFMLAAHRQKGRSRNSKVEATSQQQLQAAHEDYEEEATLFVFRLKSLKQGQSRSLLTQAARHYAAQLCFFRKGLKSLEVVEPNIKVVAEQQHIDYQFNGLEDDDSDDDDDYLGYDGNDDGELSFDYGQNDHSQDDLSTSRRNSMEVDQGDHIFVQASSREPLQEDLDKNEEELISFRRPRSSSQSAPIFPDKKFDRPSSTRKFHTYVLPTPVDAKSPPSTGRPETKGGLPAQFWHSSPLQPYKSMKDFRDGELPSPPRPMKAQSVLRESNTKSGLIRMPPPLVEELSLHHSNSRTTDTRKFKRHAFSGPLTSKTSPNKPMYTPSVDYFLVRRVSTSGASISPIVSPTASPSPMSSPKINELHELPRPPINFARRTRPSSLIGHSAPLVSRGQGLSMGGKIPPIASHTASPLPTPPAAMSRSYSIPSSSQKLPTLAVAKLLETEEASSPPLTPISLNKT